MPIKFTCPHCQRAMVVNESLAGKKGRCKGCQKILTVPNLASAAKPADKGQSNSVAAKIETPAPPPSPPPPPPADVEAEAAALFSDEPKKEEPVEVKNIDLNCPYCDEPIHFPLDLAGKRAPCPECKHIIKVPELVKQEPKDWRKTEQRGPAGARLPDQPALEGAWGSATAGRVGQKSLEEAGVIVKAKPPRTLWQKTRWWAAGIAAVFLLAGVSWGGYRWWLQRGIERAVQEALAFAASPEAAKEIGAPGQAALYIDAGAYYLHSKNEEPAAEANKQFGKAITALQTARSSDERDAVLTDLAVALVELGGAEKAPETYQGLRLRWSKVQARLTSALTQIRNADARRQAVRAVSRRLIDRGEIDRVSSVVSQVYATADGEKAAALCVAGFELLKVNEKAKAATLSAAALELYKKEPTSDKDKVKKKEEPPTLRFEVVALNFRLGGKDLKLDMEPDREDKTNEFIGHIAGLARKQQWDEARRKAAQPDLDDPGRFRALLAIAAAAVDAQAADAARDADNAIKSAEKLSGNAELSWPLLRLTELALAAGVAEDRVQTLADSIVSRDVRGRAQLAVFRARLAKTPQPVAEGIADKIESKSLSHALAAADLARHNSRHGSSWIDKAKGWPQPRRAFGSLGAARGMTK